MDAKLVEVVASAINKAELQWKAENGGDYVSCLDCPYTVKAIAAINAVKMYKFAQAKRHGA